MRTSRASRLSLCAALLALSSAGCEGGDGPAAVAAEEAPPPLVEALPAREGALPLEERLSGAVRARNQVTIRAEVDAVVVEVLVRSGEAVTRGQPLVRLQDDALKQQLRQAEATVRLQESATLAARARVRELEAQVRRSRQLAAQALVTALEVEVLEAQLAGAEAAVGQAESRVELARAAVEERRADLAKTVVRAPVAGRIGLRRVEVGQLVDASSVLFQLGDLSQVVVEVPLTGQMLGYLREGQPALISTRPGGAPLRATLSRISPFLAASSLSTTAEIDVPNPEGRLFPGMFVTVDVLYGQTEQATLVPSSALWEDPLSGALGVFVIRAAAGDEDRALSSEAQPVRLCPVEVLAQGRATAGVSGVAAGEWVVTVGQHLLARGGDAAARVRPTSWERVLDLQSRHREDLLREFLDEQRERARSHGAAPPTTDDFLRAAPAAEGAGVAPPRDGDG